MLSILTRERVESEVRRLVLSLAQDLIHCVSRGRIKTPKHVTLPLTAKSLTGNDELVTILFSFTSDQSQVIPAWTGFNIKLRQEDVPRESSIGYCQVIDASPTEIPTVYTLLQRSLLIADQLGQQNVVVVFDQAIYAKALEVIWQNQVPFQRFVVRMGSFHTICSFLAEIGKRFGDAGLGVLETS